MNPIKQLQEDGMSYEEMARKTKLNIHTIYKIGNMNKSDIKDIKVSTAITIREKLGVNLWNYYTDNKYTVSE